MITTAQDAYDLHRLDTKNDMWDYAPYLRSIAKGNVLEIGMRYGVSTAAFILGVRENGGGHVYSVDIDPTCEAIYSGEPNWTFIGANSNTEPDVVIKAMHEWVDVLLIDGDHSYDAVCRDLQNYLEWVRRGGFILMHDVAPAPEMRAQIIRENWYPIDDPRRVFDEFTEANPTWPAKILPGKTGLGIIVKAQ